MEVCFVSSRTGEGLAELKSELRRRLAALRFGRGEVVGATAARCHESLRIAGECIDRARQRRARRPGRIGRCRTSHRAWKSWAALPARSTPTTCSIESSAGSASASRQGLVAERRRRAGAGGRRAPAGGGQSAARRRRAGGLRFARRPANLRCVVGRGGDLLDDHVVELDGARASGRRRASRGPTRASISLRRGVKSSVCVFQALVGPFKFCWLR